jgi:RHS repeat-associated protein
VISDGSAVYTPGISERRSSTTKYYGSDRLGTNALETNSSQAVTATKTYDAFGMPVGSTGSSASPFGFAGQHGYQEDADSGLKLLGHRYYDASTGRFLTRDRAKDGRNWYGYCENNPLKYVDPDGFKLNLVGGTKEERAEFWLALFWIWTTKEGRPLVEELLNGDKVYTIIIDPGSKTGRPNWNNNTTILFINPKDGGVEYMGTDGKYHNFSWIGLLSHELGHLVGGLGSDKEQETVDGFENKIGGQFGIPGRGKYDDTKFGKPKPLLKPPRLRFPR